MRVSMYGTRDATMNWTREYCDKLTKAGFQQGKFNSCLYHHPVRDVTIMVHGDDFIAVGQAGELKDTEELLGKH